MTHSLSANINRPSSETSVTCKQGGTYIFVFLLLYFKMAVPGGCAV